MKYFLFSQHFYMFLELGINTPYFAYSSCIGDLEQVWFGTMSFSMDKVLLGQGFLRKRSQFLWDKCRKVNFWGQGEL